MDGMARDYLLWKMNYYVLIDCIRYCVGREFIKNYFKIFKFLLIWGKDLRSYNG